MYEDFFPNCEDADQNRQVYFRFTKYLQKAIQVERAKYLKKRACEKANAEAAQRMAQTDMDQAEEQNPIEDLILREALKTELTKLSPKERVAFLYRFVYEMEDKEIAEHLNISRSGAQYLRSQAAKKLERQAEEWLYD